ncbi:MAG: hypothetical protein QNJ47_26285, partial [Nostocaceae cyanobacterium]|nr:hypothetical protein [Nostocaceae cyanobacterium]
RNAEIFYPASYTLSQVWFSTSDNWSHPCNDSDRMIHILIQQRHKPGFFETKYDADSILHP